MTPEGWKRANDLFQQALELAPEARREFLARACGEDAGLVSEVLSLLAAHREAGSFLQASTLLRRTDDATHTGARDSRGDVGGPPHRPIDHGRFAPGAIVGGRYRIVALLGRGGMGEVYRADDLTLRQSVALKLLPAAFARDPVRLERLREEVRVARQVTHPSVCRVYDIGESGGEHFLTMEYVDGEDLASLQRRIGRLPQDKAAELGRQLCAGLAAAHEAGILHRDLKPANVMIDGRGRARLTDFGLAVAAEQGPPELAGTPAYMAPELFAGEPATRRSDIYALGLVLFELFTGKPAFEAATARELARLHTGGEPPWPSSHVADLDPAAERVILACLAKDPRSRPESARRVAAALPGDPLAAALAAGETPSPELVAEAGEEGRLSVPAAAGLALAGLAMLAGWLAWGSGASLALRAPLDLAPAVLEDRAREALRLAGHPDPAADSAFGFRYDRAYIEHLEARDVSAARWAPLGRTPPAAVYFWYRRSPALLEPGDDLGRVSLADPPPLQPGMASVRLDTRGHLIELRIVPETAPSEAAADATRWDELLALTGLDRATLVEAPPAWTPPVFADERRAWDGRFPASGEPARVETAALHGWPVWLQVSGRWTSAETAWRTLSSPSAASQRSGDPLMFVVLATALVLARRNLREGRADRHGAARLAAGTALATLAFGLLEARHVPAALGEWSVLKAVLVGACFNTVASGVLYLALEPPVRRRWPSALTSWTRLIAGRWRDPLVGRDVLLGALGALVVLQLIAGHHALTAWLGQPPLRPLSHDLDSLLGARASLARLIREHVYTGFGVLLSMVVLVLLRALLRHIAAAVTVIVAVWLVLAYQAVGSGGAPLLFVTGALFVAVLFGVLFRLGGMLSILVLGVLPGVDVLPTIRLDAWYAGSTRVGVTYIAALLILGAIVSVGRRRGGRRLDL